MTTDTDLHRIIRKLSEAEWVRKSLPDFEGDPPGSVGTQSMEVPFVSLKSPCGPSITSPGPCLHNHNDVCKGRRWKPEPDVERACHRVAKTVQELDPDNAIVCWYYYKQDWVWSVRGEASHVGSYEEAVFLAGEALLEELRRRHHD